MTHTGVCVWPSLYGLTLYSPHLFPGVYHTLTILLYVPGTTLTTDIALRPQKRGCLLGPGRGWESEGSTADTSWKRPERPWTAARTMPEVLRRCPLAIAQRRLVRHCVIAVSTAVLGRVTRTTDVRCTAVEEQPEAKEVQLSQRLHLPAHDLFWANLRVQLHLPPLDLAWNP